MSAPLLALLVVLAAVAGAAVGSYSGVVAGRGWRGSLAGRSRCEGCARELRWWELVPVASYLALRGRCRRCDSRIPTSVLARELGGAGAGACLAVLAWVLAGR
jgi:prepilin signal peptidase PulO-like enzyme (type II secretory pathway)